jgi:hypothetical protein
MGSFLVRDLGGITVLLCYLHQVLNNGDGNPASEDAVPDTGEAEGDLQP